jgi:alkylhydroperoxidase family enzyme
VTGRYDGLIGRLEAAALPGRPQPDGMEAYLEKVRLHAYRVTDADIDALRDHYSEEEIFEQTVAVAVASGLERLTAAKQAIG